VADSSNPLSSIQGVISHLPALFSLYQRTVDTDIAATVHDVRTTDDANVTGIAAQLWLFHAEVRILRVDWPHYFPLEIYNDLQASATGRTDHAPGRILQKL